VPTYLFHIFTHPQRDRRSPETVTRNVPVSSIGKPIPESTISDVLRYPEKVNDEACGDLVGLPSASGSFVILDKLVNDGLYSGRDSAFDQWLAGS
jgi:hypothetical protein